MKIRIYLLAACTLVLSGCFKEKNEYQECYEASLAFATTHEKYMHAPKDESTITNWMTATKAAGRWRNKVCPESLGPKAIFFGELN